MVQYTEITEITGIKLKAMEYTKITDFKLAQKLTYFFT